MLVSDAYYQWTVSQEAPLKQAERKALDAGSHGYELRAENTLENLNFFPV